MTASVSGARPRGTSKPHRGAGVRPRCFWTVPRASAGLLEGMTVLAQARCKPSHLPRMMMGLPSRVWAPEKPRGPPFSPESYFLQGKTHTLIKRERWCRRTERPIGEAEALNRARSQQMESSELRARGRGGQAALRLTDMMGEAGVLAPERPFPSFFKSQGTKAGGEELQSQVEFGGGAQSHRVTWSPLSHPVSEGRLRGEWGD